MIKNGLIPAEFTKNPHVQSQKNSDTRWTKKNDEKYLGYKNHISVDVKHQLIRKYACTSVEGHYSNEFESPLTKNTRRDVWADSAYRSEEKERRLKALVYRSQVHRKGNRAAVLSKQQKKQNKQKSKISE